MTRFREKASPAMIVTVLFSFLMAAGCAPAIKYSYDLKTNFSELKTYTWVKPSSMYGNDPLLETNVQVLTDQILARKGFSRALENPDLALSMSYEFDSDIYPDSYRLRMLSLYVYVIRRDMLPPPNMPGMPMQPRNAPQPSQLVWRGTAAGAIKTDAASGNLKHVVEEILSNFPPRIR